MIKIGSGKKVLDWIVPKEWELAEAYVKNSKNKKIIDFEMNNLSVTSYSQPVNKILDLKDLKKKLYSLPNLPNAIPYTTTYYKKEWGFNISHNEKKKLKKGKFHVVIKSKFKKGNLILGEKILKGSSDKYFLLSSYLCHPSLANNELGGPLALVGLFNKIREYKDRRLNYIF